MIDSIFSILGIDLSTIHLSDDVIVIIAATVFLFCLDWIFHFLGIFISTFTRRR